MDERSSEELLRITFTSPNPPMKIYAAYNEAMAQSASSKMNAKLTER